MSSTRPIISEWASVVSRRKLQLACAGGRRDVSILHRLVLISNFERHAHDIEPLPAPLPATEPDALSDSMDIDSDSDGPVTPDISFAVDSDSPGCQSFDDPDSPLQSLFDEPASRSPIIRTCVPHNPFFISTYC
ncbi:hypothetical protein FRC07_011239 [Ceratobasidium sp. 392]|nr:hypothetical protein FRC07_011239 [Ceratobasidium sp. 392]